jgi:chaperonin GroES
MKLKPIGERVILKPIKAEERTKSGIYLPESSNEKKQGEIVEVGTLKNGSPIPLSKGDKILYGGYSSEEFEMEGQTLLIIDYKDILAKVEEPNLEQQQWQNK